MSSLLRDNESSDEFFDRMKREGDARRAQDAAYFDEITAEQKEKEAHQLEAVAREASMLQLEINHSPITHGKYTLTKSKNSVTIQTDLSTVELQFDKVRRRKTRGQKEGGVQITLDGANVGYYFVPGYGEEVELPEQWESILQLIRSASDALADWRNTKSPEAVERKQHEEQTRRSVDALTEMADPRPSLLPPPEKSGDETPVKKTIWQKLGW